MSDSQIIAFRHPSESDRHWMLRAEFLEKYNSEFPQHTLLSLAQAFADAELQGHSHLDCTHELPEYVLIAKKDVKISKDAPKKVQESPTKKKQRSTNLISDAGILSQNRRNNAAVKDDSQGGNTSRKALSKKSVPSKLTLSPKSKNACPDVSRDNKKSITASEVLHKKTDYHDGSKENKKRNYTYKKMPISGVLHDKTQCHGESRRNKKSVICEKLPVSKVSHEKTNCHENSKGNKESSVCKKLPVSKVSHKKTYCCKESRGNKESVTSKKLPITKVSHVKTDCHEVSRGSKESVTCKKLPVSKISHKKTDCHEVSRGTKESVTCKKLPVSKISRKKTDCHEVSRGTKKSVTCKKLPVSKISREKTVCNEVSRRTQESVTCKKLPVIKVEKTDYHEETRRSKENVTCKKLPVLKVSHEKTGCLEESKGNKESDTCKKLPISKGEKTDCCQGSRENKKINIACKKLPVSQKKTDYCDESGGNKKRKFPISDVPVGKTDCCDAKKSKKLPVSKASREKAKSGESISNNKKNITCKKLKVSCEKKYCHDDSRENKKSSITCKKLSVSGVPHENVDCHEKKLPSVESGAILSEVTSQSSSQESVNKINSLPKCLKGNSINILQPIKKSLTIKLNAIDTLHIVAKRFNFKFEFCTEKLPTGFVSSLKMDTVFFCKAGGSTVEKAQTAVAKLAIDKLMRMSQEVGNLSENYSSKSSVSCKWETSDEIIVSDVSGPNDKSVTFKGASKAVDKSPTSLAACGVVEKLLTSEAASGAVEKPPMPEVASGAVDELLTSEVASDAVDKSLTSEVASGATENLHISQVPTGVEKPLTSQVASGANENSHTSQVASGATENPHTSQVASEAVDQSLTSEVDSFWNDSNVPDRFRSCIHNGMKKDLAAHNPYEETDHQNESLNVLGSTAYNLDSVPSKSSSEEAIDEIDLLPKHLKDNFHDILQMIKKNLSKKLHALNILHIVAKMFNLQLKYNIKTLQSHSFECCLNIDAMLICKAEGPTVKKARTCAAESAIDKLTRLGQKVLFSDSDPNLLKFSDRKCNEIKKNLVGSIKQEVVVSETAGVICDDVCRQHINGNSLDCMHSVPSDIRNTVFNRLSLYQNSLGTTNQTNIAVGCTDSNCNVYGEKAISNSSKRHTPSDFHKNTVCKRKALDFGNNRYITSEICKNPNFPDPQSIAYEKNTLNNSNNRYISSDLYTNINLTNLRHNMCKNVSSLNGNSSSGTCENTHASHNLRNQNPVPCENKSSQNKTDIYNKEELMSAEQESAIPGIWEGSCVNQQKPETVSLGSTKAGMSRSTTSVLNPSNTNSVINGSYSLNTAHDFPLASKPIINHKKRQTFPKPLRSLIAEKKKMHKIWKKSRNPSDKFVFQQLNKIVNIALMGYRSNHWDVLEHNTRIAVDIARLWKPVRMKRNARVRT